MGREIRRLLCRRQRLRPTKEELAKEEEVAAECDEEGGGLWPEEGEGRGVYEEDAEEGMECVGEAGVDEEVGGDLVEVALLQLAKELSAYVWSEDDVRAEGGVGGDER